jgi:DNA-directed RNA polymerase specialized sigma24 family protein
MTNGLNLGPVGSGHSDVLRHHRVGRSRTFANRLDDLTKVHREMNRGSDQGKRAVREHRQPRKISHRLSREQVDRLVAEYLGGTPTPELCRRYPLGKSTVLGLLKGAGVQMRKQGLPDNRVAEAVSRYEQGWTAPQIADHYGVSASNIRARLREAGVTLRDSRRRRRVDGFDPST